MISYQEALALIEKNTESLPSQVLPLNLLCGLGLARPIVAPFDLPLFDNSSVDGFGIQLEDVQQASPTQPARLKLIGAIKAGDRGELNMRSGECVRLFTGALVPTVADAVVMQEFCRLQNGMVEVLRSAEKGENVRKRGGEFREGAELLPAGVRVTPPVIGLLASLGYHQFDVGMPPKVSIIVTGDELVEPGGQLLPGQVYDANTYSLASALSAMGIETMQIYFTPDDKTQVKSAFEIALKESDVVLSSGGVSVGEFDFVKEVLGELGVSTVFWQVSIKPGKPLYFGLRRHSSGGERNTLVFGLPGNTVSSLTTFHQFIRPALLKMMCISQNKSARFTGTLGRTRRKSDPRLDFMRGNWITDESGLVIAQPSGNQQSHMLSGLAGADCLIHFPLELDVLDEGQTITIDRLSWFE